MSYQIFPGAQDTTISNDMLTIVTLRARTLECLLIFNILQCYKVQPCLLEPVSGLLSKANGKVLMVLTQHVYLRRMLRVWHHLYPEA
jgi:hypothetical protein